MLADGGGSNSSRHYIFKEDLQNLSDEIGVEIRVAHYPPCTSKWNPVEHRVFPHITRYIQVKACFFHQIPKDPETQHEPSFFDNLFILHHDLWYYDFYEVYKLLKALLIWLCLLLIYLPYTTI